MQSINRILLMKNISVYISEINYTKDRLGKFQKITTGNGNSLVPLPMQANKGTNVGKIKRLPTQDEIIDLEISLRRLLFEKWKFENTLKQEQKQN